jgi:hypothetical protein
MGRLRSNNCVWLLDIQTNPELGSTLMRRLVEAIKATAAAAITLSICASPGELLLGLEALRRLLDACDQAIAAARLVLGDRR